MGIRQILEKHKGLLKKFCEIADQKVSIIDEYGDENWEALESELTICAIKLCKREDISIYFYAPRYGRSKRSRNEQLSNECAELRTALRKVFLEYRSRKIKSHFAGPDINSMSGIEFETYVATTLKKCGFNDIRGTPGSGDQGADLILRINGRIIVIQAKRYVGTVGNSAVQEVIAAKCFYGANEGWVITNSTFSTSAKALASQSNVKLIDKYAMQKLGEVLKNLVK